MHCFFLNFDAIKFLLKRPKLILLSLLPLLIALVLTIILIYFIAAGFSYVTNLDATNSQTNWFFTAILYLLHIFHSGFLKWVAIILISICVLWLSFSLFSGLILSPFLEMISEAVEKELRKEQAHSYPWYKGLVSSLLFSVGLAIIKLITLGLIFLISFTFPPIAIINFILIAWYASAEAIDCSLSRHIYPIQKKISFLLSHKKDLFMLGSFAAILTAIPVLNIIQPVISTIAATMYFVEKTPNTDMNNYKINTIINSLLNKN